MPNFVPSCAKAKPKRWAWNFKEVGATRFVMLSGANTINGFRNRDLRARLAGGVFLRASGRCIAKQSAKISRFPRRFHIYGLIAKVPRTRRWRLTKKGKAVLSAAVSLKEHTFPVLCAHASE